MNVDNGDVFIKLSGSMIKRLKRTVNQNCVNWHIGNVGMDE